MEQDIIDLGILHTTFIFERNIDVTEDTLVNIFCHSIDDEKFATLECADKKVIFAIERFDEWKPIHMLLQFGKKIIDSIPSIQRIILETHEEMEQEVLYLFQTQKIVWYAPFGYLPFHNKWNADRIKDFYQLAFSKPNDFLDLEYGKDLIFPSRITFTKYENPIFLHCQKDPTSFRFRVLPVTSFYKSKRPINSMTNLRQKNCLVMDASKIPDHVKKSGAPFQIQNEFYIPVIRYSMGMRQGCYFDPCPKQVKYLGTFYYWEPESNIYLNMGTRFEYFNSKLECAGFLQNKLLDYQEKTNSPTDPTSLYEYLDKNIKKIIKDMIETFYKYYDEESMIFEKSIEYGEDAEEEEIEDLLFVDFHKLYCNRLPKYLPIDLEFKSKLTGEYMKKLFYAAEDELDQPLAKTLQFFGYDVVIFGKMAGSYRIVSEVLDVRTREQSLSKLVWTII